MYKFHGWVQLLASFDPENEDDLDEAALERLRGMVDEINRAAGMAVVRPMNGEKYLLLHGAHNRRAGRAERVKSLIEFAASRFPGSHGLLYEWDEQTKTEHGFGVWSVSVIKRGRVERALDPFLSPTVPVTEDPYPSLGTDA